MYGKILVFVSPLSYKVFKYEGVIENISRAIKKELKVYVEVKAFNEGAFVVDFVIFSVTKRKHRVTLASKALLQELLPADFLCFGDAS